MKKECDFFVGIDSDGCAFDTMEVKHKACFYPMTVRHWEMASVAKHVRDAWDFVNLYSKDRGCNRFDALIKVLDLVRERKEVKQLGVRIHEASGVREWKKREKKLANPALKAEVERTGDQDLKRALEWSLAINEEVEKTVFNVPPFPHVRESLEKMRGKADVIVVSATPGEALEREWAEHDIAKYAKVIAGQEMGKKDDHLRLAAAGRWPNDRILMIGDAPGDMKAARSVNALFFPINPGDEVASWKRFLDEGLDRFLKGAYAGKYEEKLIREFDKYLPERPWWVK
jgi:HAD superfamily hydrolase (TIGR01549 family)